MKIKRYLAMATCAVFALPMMTSCLDDNAPDYEEMIPNYVVTVKTKAETGETYLQLDDKTTAKPTNYKSMFKTEVRALTHIQEADTEHDGYDHAVKVVWLDSILTKDPVDMAAAMSPAEGAGDPVDYGDDGVEIVDSPFTVVEDGYITLYFQTLAGYNTKHWLNLLVNTDREDPYLVEFRQKTENGDGFTPSYGFVAFRLKDVLPDTGGKEVDLTLKWKSISGKEKTHKFKYCTPKVQ